MDDCALHKSVTITVWGTRHSNKAQADVMALDLKADIEAQKALILDKSENFRAAELADRIKSPNQAAFTAFYLVSPDEDFGVVKIGIADNPKVRLCGLQVGNWHKLEIRALLWFNSAAADVERTALRAAKEMGIRLRGEWLACSIDEAALLMLKAARYEGYPCYDSKVWIENWASRLDAVAEMRGIKSRIAA